MELVMMIEDYLEEMIHMQEMERMVQEIIQEQNLYLMIKENLLLLLFLIHSQEIKTKIIMMMIIKKIILIRTMIAMITKTQKNYQKKNLKRKKIKIKIKIKNQMKIKKKIMIMIIKKKIYLIQNMDWKEEIIL